MKSWWVRAQAFLLKEIHDIRRQPRLLLSLIGGPFLVLALFGATFRSSQPVLRTVLVWPERGVPGVERQEVVEIVDRRFDLVAVVSSRQEAMQMLEDGRVDVVQVVPGDILARVEEGRRPELQTYSRAIDPVAEAWIRSLVLGEANFLNRELLLQQTGRAQDRAVSIQVELSDAQGVLAQIKENLTPERQEQALGAVRTLRRLLTALLVVLPAYGDAQEGIAPQVRALRQEILVLIEDLNNVDQILRSASIEEQVEHLERIGRQIESLQTTISIFIGLPPESIVSPIQPTYLNLRGEAYSLVIFYAPGVLALLLQHLAITLGALGLVRERLMGSFELFRIAPLSIIHLLIGKTLAYTLYVLVTGTALALLLRLLGVPLLGPVAVYFALVLLLTLASIGIGLLISSVSSSNSQAIQLTMLSLLLSIFFSGFFLPLPGFSPLVRPVSAALPMTHGLAGLQSLMLLGRLPGLDVWLGLLLIALAAYGLVLVVLRRVYSRVLR